MQFALSCCVLSARGEVLTLVNAPAILRIYITLVNANRSWEKIIFQVKAN